MKKVKAFLFKPTGKYYATLEVDDPVFTYRAEALEACRASASTWGAVRGPDEYLAEGWSIIVMSSPPVLIAGGAP